jgi:hypothetical protein
MMSPEGATQIPRDESNGKDKYCRAPLGHLRFTAGSLTQGCALGYLVQPLWGIALRLLPEALPGCLVRPPICYIAPASRRNLLLSTE